jgi:hypothetical protein
MCGKKIVPGAPLLLSLSPQRYTPEGGTGFLAEKLSDREVIETMQHETHHRGNDAHAALHALLAGAEGCGPAARSARNAQDDELADFLCRADREIAGEARRLLAERVAE